MTELDILYARMKELEFKVQKCTATNSERNEFKVVEEKYCQLAGKFIDENKMGVLEI